jgi:5-hydroxyisourate hydrolase-like protein (transthyretin family)
MRIRFATIFLLLAFSFIALAQTDKPSFVSGRITTLWGEPIEKAKVSFYKLKGFEGISPTEKLTQTVFTDKDGNYKATLSHGHYRVEIVGSRFGHTEVWRFYVGDGDDRILDFGVSVGNWHIVLPMRVQGTVTDDTGKPVSDVTVTMMGVHIPNIAETWVSTQVRTDEKGSYSIGTLEVGDYVLIASKPNYLPASTAFRLNNGEKKNQNLEIKVAPKFEFLPKKK